MPTDREYFSPGEVSEFLSHCGVKIAQHKQCTAKVYLSYICRGIEVMVAVMVDAVS